MQSNTKQIMTQAQTLIKQKKYNEAKVILQDVNHPKATEWLTKIEAITQKKSRKQGRGSQIASFGINWGETIRRFIILIIVIIAVGLNLSRMQGNLTNEFNSIFNYIIMPAVLLLLAIILAYPAIMAVISKPNTKIYDNGIEYNGKFISWKNVEGVKGAFLPIKSGVFLTLLTIGSHKLYKGSQDLIKLTAFNENMEEQYRLINNLLIDTHKDDLVAKAKQGSLDLGSMKIENGSSLIYEGDELSLNQLKEIEIYNDAFWIIKQDGKKWKSLSKSSVDNPFVTQAVINELAQGH